MLLGGKLTRIRTQLDSLLDYVVGHTCTLSIHPQLAWSQSTKWFLLFHFIFSLYIGTGHRQHDAYYRLLFFFSDRHKWSLLTTFERIIDLY